MYKCSFGFGLFPQALGLPEQAISISSAYLNPMAMMAPARRSMLCIWGRKNSQRSFHTLNTSGDSHIKTLCQTNRLTEAVETFSHLLSAKSNPTITTCNLLLSSLVRRNRHQSALRVYRLMVEADIGFRAFFSISHCGGPDTSLCRLKKHLCSCG